MKRNKLLLTALIMAVPALNGCSMLGDLAGLLDPLNIFKQPTDQTGSDNQTGDGDNTGGGGGGAVTPKPKVVIDGDLTKRSYQFTDNWDLSGIVVKINDGNGNLTTVEQGQYTITATPEKPSAFIGSLQLKVVVPGYLYVTRNFDNSYITVGAEQYNFDSEVQSYYSGLGTNSLKNLQTHSFNKHTKWVNYGELKNYYAVKDGHRSVDEIPGKYKNQGYYNGRELSIGGNNVEKEHVWACANTNGLYVHNESSGVHYVDNPTYTGAGSDLLQIRPCVGDVNKARGNCKFTELGTRGTLIKESGDPYGFRVSNYSTENGKPAFAKYGEPDDGMKGDLVRTIAYIYMHYGNHGGEPSSQSSKCGSLSLNDVFDISGTGYSNVKALMVAWNQLDPVSEVEKYRNHTVEKIQGNRNPFVDHPEWISSLL